MNQVAQKEIQCYVLLTALVICGLAGSLITAPKIVHLVIDFPFSNIIFALLTYPIVDCICELWGKQAARQAMWIGLGGQLLITLIIQLSILAPTASFWHLQSAYQLVLATGTRVVIASLIAFAISQLMDIVIYQKLKEITGGKKLWLRSNLSTYFGQMIDSILFINIIFISSNEKWHIVLGSILVKVILSFLMTPFVYLIIYIVNRYLETDTLAYTVEKKMTTNQLTEA